MSILTDAEIILLTEQCSVLEAELRDKRDYLHKAIVRKLANEAEQFPLSAFVGRVGFYDRPYKWSKARVVEFKPEDLVSYQYLKFNGIVTGEQLNTMYDSPIYGNKSQYYSFVIPDERFTEYADVYVDVKGQPIPLHAVYEILIFEV